MSSPIFKEAVKKSFRLSYGKDEETPPGEILADTRGPFQDRPPGRVLQVIGGIF
jgi:hypothetical protein